MSRSLHHKNPASRRAPNGIIEPGVLYTKEALKSVLNLGDAGFRRLLQDGLRVHYVRNSPYIWGADFIEHVFHTGSPTWNGNGVSESQETTSVKRRRRRQAEVRMNSAGPGLEVVTLLPRGRGAGIFNPSCLKEKTMRDEKFEEDLQTLSDLEGHIPSDPEIERVRVHAVNLETLSNLEEHIPSEAECERVRLYVENLQAIQEDEPEQDE